MKQHNVLLIRGSYDSPVQEKKLELEMEVGWSRVPHYNLSCCKTNVNIAGSTVEHYLQKHETEKM